MFTSVVSGEVKMRKIRNDSHWEFNPCHWLSFLALLTWSKSTRSVERTFEVAVQSDRICKRNHQIRSAPGSILPSFAAKTIRLWCSLYVDNYYAWFDGITVPCLSWSAVAMRALTSLQASFTPMLRFGRPFADRGLGVTPVATLIRYVRI